MENKIFNILYSNGFLFNFIKIGAICLSAILLFNVGKIIGQYLKVYL